MQNGDEDVVLAKGEPEKPETQATTPARPDTLADDFTVAKVQTTPSPVEQTENPQSAMSFEPTWVESFSGPSPEERAFTTPPVVSPYATPPVTPGVIPSDALTPPPVTPYPGASTPPPFGPSAAQRVIAPDNWQPKKPRRKLGRKFVIISSCLVVLVLCAAVWAVLLFVPAGSMTVEVHSAGQPLKESVIVNVVAEQSASPAGVSDAKGHKLVFTTREMVKTVPVKGMKHQIAQSATGKLVFTNISGTEPEATFKRVQHNGLDILTQAFRFVQGETVTVEAVVMQPGSAGNIPAHALDGPFIFTSSKTTGGIMFDMSNPDPFTGGVDERDYQAVQQSDIDGVVKEYRDKLVAEGQEGVKKLVGPEEKVALNGDEGIICIDKATANHKIDDEATEVTVRVKEECSVLAYKQEDLQKAALEKLKEKGHSKPGTELGPLNVKFGDVKLVSALKDVAMVEIAAEGKWIFQPSESKKEQLTRLLAGKRQDEAKPLLLKEAGVTGVDFKPDSLGGLALPADPKHITIKVTTP